MVMWLKKKTYGWLILILIIGTAGLRCLSAIAPVGAQPAVHWNNKVYVAFGFHGNLYHSFRGDTNDESGFGKDIRVIRHILATLDRFNEQGVPVRASWEFDNHFSLEHLLPEHAPDIIKAVKRRVSQGRDEVLLMSYNNGLASAMTREEFTDAVNWSISNPWGSGVKDIFGSYSPIVRPQEMMTTLSGLSATKPFEVGQRYYAVIETVISDQDTPVRTEEFCLDILSSTRISAQAKIPWHFPLKVLWANMMAFCGV